MIYSIDFETRSKVKIKHGLSNYFSQAEPLFLGWDNGLWDFRNPDNKPLELLDHVANGGKVSAWNAMFEYYAWNRLMVPMYDWPELKLNQLIDTAAMAAAANLPQKLATCGKVLDVGEDQLKNQRGNYLIKHLTIPRKPTKTNPALFFEEPELMDEFGEYCEQDIVAEKAIFNKLPRLSEYEQNVWELTQRINMRGVPVDMDLVNKVNGMREEHHIALEQRSHELIGFSVTQTAKITDYLGLKNVQAETVEEAIQTATGERLEVLQLRKAMAGTGASKFAKAPELVCDDVVRDLFVYHGANTGRYASRGGWNVQNFTRPTIDQDYALRAVQTGDLDFLNFLGDPSEFFNSVTRSIIHGDFTDADFSSIENRVASWVSEDSETLELFREGLDQYKDMAVQMYNVSYDEVTKDQRQVAKSAVLGGQFGQGPKGFIKFAAGYGVTIDEDESKRIIDAYRMQYKKIVRLWYRMGDLSIESVRNKGTEIKINKHLSFCHKGDFLMMKLPSGRKLYFYKPKVESKETPWGEMRDVVTTYGMNTYTRQWCRNKYIGANFFQSAVQAIARDLLVYAMFTVEAAGSKIRMTVHDEILADRHPDISVEKFCELMCKKPLWAKGLPIQAEGWNGPRYRK